MADARGVALVTGANRGIGFEVCRQLATAGFEVILTARDGAKGEAAASRLQSEGLNVSARALDVSDETSVTSVRDWLQAERGVLDVLVNNAAINYDTWENVLTADFAVVEAALQTNTVGPWRMTQAFLPLLKRSEHPRVVNVSSTLGQWGNLTGRSPAYNLSKLALNGLTCMLANSLRADRVLVNSVCPGWVATDMGGSGGRPVTAGAASVVWAALVPDGGPTGGFFRDGQPIAF